MHSSGGVGGVEVWGAWRLEGGIYLKRVLLMVICDLSISTVTNIRCIILRNVACPPVQLMPCAL